MIDPDDMDAMRPETPMARGQSITLSDAQKRLDRHVLQHMEECRDRSWDRHEWAFHLRAFTNEWVTHEMARAVCRSLTDRGFAHYMRGMWCEDGMPFGAGYGITDKGAEYLETLCREAGE